MKKYLFLLSTCVLMSACGKNEASESPTASTAVAPASTVSSQTVYRVFTEQSYPPFIMHSGVDQIDGFEYDLLNEIGKRQGFTVKFIPYVWEGLFKTLNEGKADIVSSGITITDERKQQMLFSDPYFETETVLLLNKDAQSTIHKFADMRGQKIAVKRGTLQDNLVKQYGGNPIYEDSSWLTVKSTISHDTLATLGDFGVLAYFAQKYPSENLAVVKNPTSPKEQLGFAVKKDNIALQTKLNDGLKQLKTDGTYQQLYQKWFGQ